MRSLARGVRQAARLVGELSDLRQMMDSLKRMITGQGLEEENGETGEETEEKARTCDDTRQTA